MEVMALTKSVDDDGEGESKLMDRYERMSFEIQLNKAIHFGRSLSHPHFPTTTTTVISPNTTYSKTTSSSKHNAPNSSPPPHPTAINEVREGLSTINGTMSRSSTNNASTTSNSRTTRGFNKVLKKLIKPGLWRKKSSSSMSEDDHIQNNGAQQEPKLPNNKLTSWKKFSKSLRVV